MESLPEAFYLPANAQRLGLESAGESGASTSAGGLSSGGLATTTDGLFESTALTRGPWSPEHQHGGPPSALLARAIEERLAAEAASHHRPDGSPMAAPTVTRMTIEFLRPVAIAPLGASAWIERSGKQVTRLRANLTQAGKTVARASALAIRRVDLPLGVSPVSSERAAADAPRSPAESTPFEFPFFVDPVGYQRAVEIRILEGRFGSGALSAWMRLRTPLVAGEFPTPLQRLAVAADSGNGLSVALDLDRYTFINPDLTIHILRPMSGEWLGMDARTEAADTGNALAQARLFDEAGTVGRSLQSLIVAERSDDA